MIFICFRNCFFVCCGMHICYIMLIKLCISCVFDLFVVSLQSVNINHRVIKGDNSWKVEIDKDKDDAIVMGGEIKMDKMFANMVMPVFYAAHSIKDLFLYISRKEVTILDTSKMDTSEENSFNYAFANYTSVPLLYLCNWKTSHITSMIGMFDGCISLEELYINSFDFSNVKKIEDVDFMFRNCDSLTILKFGKNLKVSLDLHYCPLTHESALSVIDGLAKVEEQQVLTFSKKTYDTLSLEDIKKAID